MKHVQRFSLLIVLLLCLYPVSVAADRVTMSIGHTGAVRTAAADPSGNYAFTGGNDGRLSVWDLEAGALYTTFQIGPNPITAIARHPNRDDVVVFSQRGVTSGTLIAINWRTREELFRRELNTIPNYLAYSPAGSYLVYALPSYRSLYFLSAEDGRELPLLDTGFGIVGFVQIAPSERNVIAYVPSRGEMIYFRVATGEELMRISTVSRLQHVTVIDTQTRRYLAAADGDNLVVIDNYTGEMKAEYPLSPILEITYDAESGLISVLTEQRGRRTAIGFTYTSGRLRRDSFSPQFVGDQIEAYASVGSGATRGYVSGDSAGQVVYYAARTGRPTVLGTTPLATIDALAVTDGRLHLLMDNRLLTVTSDYFAERSAGERATRVRSSSMEIPGATLDGITADGDQLLVWGSDEQGSVVWTITPPYTNADVTYRSDTQAAITLVRATATNPLVVRRDGRIVQLSNLAGITQFEYSALGAQDALWNPDIGVVAAKTRTSSFDTSLVVVDLSTRETLPVDTEAFLTSRVELDPRSLTLYSLSLVGSQSAPITRLTRHSGRAFARSQTLQELPGEYSSADIVWDMTTNSLITSLSTVGVVRYSANSTSAVEFEPAAHLATQLVPFNGLLLARNTDGTATVWDSRTGAHLLDLYMLGDDQWIAMATGGAFLSSSRSAERYLHFYSVARSRLTIDDFRASLPFERE